MFSYGLLFSTNFSFEHIIWLKHDVNCSESSGLLPQLHHYYSIIWILAQCGILVPLWNQKYGHYANVPIEFDQKQCFEYLNSDPFGKQLLTLPMSERRIGGKCHRSKRKSIYSIDSSRRWYRLWTINYNVLLGAKGHWNDRGGALLEGQDEIGEERASCFFFHLISGAEKERNKVSICHFRGFVLVVLRVSFWPDKMTHLWLTWGWHVLTVILNRIWGFFSGAPSMVWLTGAGCLSMSSFGQWL